MPAYHAVKFTDSDIVNLDEFIPQGEYNPHNVRPFLLHDHGLTLAVVFASNLNEALDIAADEGKLDAFAIPADEYDENEAESYTYLGNASEPFDIENVDALELPIPRMSFSVLFEASRQTVEL